MTLPPPREEVTHAEGTRHRPGLAVPRPAPAGAWHAVRVFGGTRRGTA